MASISFYQKIQSDKGFHWKNTILDSGLDSFDIEAERETSNPSVPITYVKRFDFRGEPFRINENILIPPEYKYLLSCLVGFKYKVSTPKKGEYLYLQSILEPNFEKRNTGKENIVEVLISFQESIDDR
jgi:hypothetical protein